MDGNFQGISLTTELLRGNGQVVICRLLEQNG